MDERTVLAYIAKTQPTLEKQAAEKDDFLVSLNRKLATYVDNHLLRGNEAAQILKKASENPSSIFDYFSLPASNANGLRLNKMATSSKSKGDEIFERILLEGE